MLKIHCDHEGCTTSADLDPSAQNYGGGPPIPEGWFAVSWKKRYKGTETHAEKAIGGIMGQLSASLPVDPVSGKPTLDFGKLLPPAVSMNRFQAFLCPDHGSALPLGQFHKVAEERVFPDGPSIPVVPPAGLSDPDPE